MPLPPLICPACQTPLTPSNEQIQCPGCGHRYANSSYWDFAPSLRFVDVESPCHVDERGERLRAERYYLPLLRDLAQRTARSLSELSVLDDGCGFGAAVEQLRTYGVQAYGIDVGWRARDWDKRKPPWPYLRADGRALPFADGTFDAVVSFGVIEHVGIEGESGASEQVAADYQQHRARYVAEALRVVRSPGIVVLSQPNGSCPVDFWHYPGSIPARLHSPGQPFLPRYREIRQWAHRAESGVEVRSLSPYGIVNFERIRGWWFGRLFWRVVRTWFAALRLTPLRSLTRGPLNPFLVVLLRKGGDGASTRLSRPAPVRRARPG
ncbi:MAG TPA: methyltransferase domain-containing protein [Solirubrobacteraceae bacterium]|nr:methyltransferase domain-containing protein [Solirubrobacteraceae bacterium]